MAGSAGTVVPHDALVRALEARGYETRGGAHLASALDRYLTDHGYPLEARQLRDRSFHFWGAAEGAAEVLSSTWFGQTSSPPLGSPPADAPPVKLARLGGLSDPRVVAGVATVGAGALVLGVVLAVAWNQRQA